MKKTISVIICFLVLVGLFSAKPSKLKYHTKSSVSFSSQAPADYSGVNGFTCRDCHGSFALNSGGGNVVVTGLPLSGYTPGQSYPLSVRISHGTANRTRWGMALKAQNGVGVPAGTFIAGPNTTVISDISANDTSEIGHNAAATTPASNSYTYTGITWIAPRIPIIGDNNISFYAVGNAANNNSSTSGDYIHTAVYANIALPIKLSSFSTLTKDNTQVLLQWQTEQESNSSHFSIERSFDGFTFAEIGRVQAKENTTNATEYKFTDINPIQINKAIQYRLKMVDKDGQFTYSDLRQAMLSSKQTVLKNVLPNPVLYGSTFAIEIAASKQEDVIIEVVGLNGSLLLQKKARLNTGYNKLQLNGSEALLPGTYALKLILSDQQQSQPFVIL